MIRRAMSMLGPCWTCREHGGAGIVQPWPWRSVNQARNPFRSAAASADVG